MTARRGGPRNAFRDRFLFALRFTFQDALALLESGAVDVKPLLSERLPIDRFAEALGLAGSGEALKVQIQPR